MTYIAKWPISVISKNRNQAHYRKQSEFNKCYGYLDLDKNNQLHLYFSLSGRKRSLRIDCSKEYLLEALLLNLSVRPIYRNKKELDSNMWINAHPGKLIEQQSFNAMPAPVLREKFTEVMSKMGMLAERASDKQQKLAQKQFEELQGKQWKMDLITSMYNAEQLIKDD